MSPSDMWSGASIHEIAQVVAAAFQNGKESGDFGTIAKLSRVILLAPVVLTLGWAAMRTRRGPASERSGQSVPMPWFVLGFVGLMLFNSLDVLPLAAKAWAVQATTFLLTVALAGMGLQADIRKLKAKRLKPLLVGAGAWVFISIFSLGLIELVY